MNERDPREGAYKWEEEDYPWCEGQFFSYEASPDDEVLDPMPNSLSPVRMYNKPPTTKKKSCK